MDADFPLMMHIKTAALINVEILPSAQQAWGLGTTWSLVQVIKYTWFGLVAGDEPVHLLDTVGMSLSKAPNPQQLQGAELLQPSTLTAGHQLHSFVHVCISWPTV